MVIANLGVYGMNVEEYHVFKSIAKQTAECKDIYWKGELLNVSAFCLGWRFAISNHCINSLIKLKFVVSHMDELLFDVICSYLWMSLVYILTAQVIQPMV